MRSEGPPLVDVQNMLWVGDIPLRWAATHPDRPAIIVPEAGRTVSFRQLSDMSATFVESMTARGLRPGDRIAYLGTNSDLFFVALFGAIAGGFVLLPLNWRCAAPELGYMLADARTSLVLVDAAYEVTLARAIDAEASLTGLKTLVTEGSQSLREAVERAPHAPHPAPHDPGQVCLQLYTSGTTGRPKGVLCTHGGLSYARHAELISPDWAGWTGEEDVALSALPNFHIGGMSWMLIGLVRGLPCVLTADASIGNILGITETYGVTRTFLVPTVVGGILDHLKATGQAPPAFRTITYGAAVMSETLLRNAIAVLGCQFGQYFGMTEVTGTIAFLSPDDHDLDRPHLLTSVGRPQHGMAIEIRDSAGRVLPAGQAGEIWARTPTLMAGYWNLSDATAEAIVDGWYRTGDGGRLDAEGYLYMTDRIRDMIISGGENIYPAEVEAVLRRHPAVQDVAVIGVPDARWGERVIAVVEASGVAGSDTADQLIAFTQEHLARYKCPKTVHFVSTLPRTPMGKIKRGAVRADLLADAS